MMEKVRIVPTWEAATQIYVMALENGRGAGQQAARDELLRLGRQYDEACDHITKLEAAARELANLCVYCGIEWECVDALIELIGEPAA